MQSIAKASMLLMLHSWHGLIYLGTLELCSVTSNIFQDFVSTYFNVYAAIDL